MRFYVAARLSQAPLVERVYATLEAAGHTISHKWTVHGNVRGEGHDRLAEAADAEIRAVRDADAVIVLITDETPMRGAHCELGAALIARRQVILWAPPELVHRLDPGPETNAFYHHRLVMAVCCDVEDFILDLPTYARAVQPAPGMAWVGKTYVRPEFRAAVEAVRELREDCTSIEDTALCLSTRARNCLLNVGCTTLAQLPDVPETAIHHMQSVGKHTLWEIKEFCAEYGITLRAQGPHLEKCLCTVCAYGRKKNWKILTDAEVQTIRGR